MGNHLCSNAFMHAAHFQERRAELLLNSRDKRIQHLRRFAPPSPANLSVAQKECFEVISSCPSKAMLFLDPPYLPSSLPRIKQASNSKMHYPSGPNWDVVLHTRLCHALKNHDKWILCHEDHPFIRKLYAGCTMVDYSEHSKRDA